MVFRRRLLWGKEFHLLLERFKLNVYVCVNVRRKLLCVEHRLWRWRGDVGLQELDDLLLVLFQSLIHVLDVVAEHLLDNVLNLLSNLNGHYLFDPLRHVILQLFQLLRDILVKRPHVYLWSQHFLVEERFHFLFQSVAELLQCLCGFGRLLLKLCD